MEYFCQRHNKFQYHSLNFYKGGYNDHNNNRLEWKVLENNGIEKVDTEENFSSFHFPFDCQVFIFHLIIKHYLGKFNLKMKKRRSMKYQAHI